MLVVNMLVTMTNYDIVINMTNKVRDIIMK